MTIPPLVSLLVSLLVYVTPTIDNPTILLICLTIVNIFRYSDDIEYDDEEEYQSRGSPSQETRSPEGALHYAHKHQLYDYEEEEEEDDDDEDDEDYEDDEDDDDDDDDDDDEDDEDEEDEDEDDEDEEEEDEEEVSV